MLLIHGIDPLVLNGEENKPIFVGGQDRLFLENACKFSFWDSEGLKLSLDHGLQLEYIIFPLLYLIIKCLLRLTYSEINPVYLFGLNPKHK